MADEITFETLRECSTISRKKIKKDIEDNLDNINWDKYRNDILKQAKTASDAGEYKVNARCVPVQAIGSGDSNEYDWSAAKVYRDRFVHRLNEMFITAGFEIKHQRIESSWHKNSFLYRFTLSWEDWGFSDSDSYNMNSPENLASEMMMGGGYDSD